MAVRRNLQALVPWCKRRNTMRGLAVNRWMDRFPSYPERNVRSCRNIDRKISSDKGQACGERCRATPNWAAQFFRYPSRTFVTSGGLHDGIWYSGAIGAQLGRPKDLVVCISGDGGAQMNFQEVVVAVEHQLPVVFVIINNQYLGMVRQWQELFYQRRYAGVTMKQENRPANEHVAKTPGYLPDFMKLAEAHGAKGRRIDNAQDVAPALAEAFASDKTWVLEFIVTQEANVFPMIPPGAADSDIINRTV